ncbi:MAG TPA: 2-succinyl-5-enolpyruvyl-6-hydroxy-3-cyclohexene-1-carboxylic-acid synthase [Caldithrix abyssi]|uniref:2-succinyl-5-enolpyruvyl-6-hydroxy-3-cyclohexene-1-carboxylate synthase n=1 Tax=Caldithrix abyssi TaxID=187145 RepID=A0A7V4U4N6_CALAY|nr:2-succinyl-5-enolpyruvyl-6-hydroxy-3-cyclohexene-1-carboxylic-acid synthase [Caldithrix abyssi]
MTSADANWNHFWSRLIISELVRQGVRYFCISPGSRSTPLTVAAAQHPQARSAIFYDERAAAFHALGYARACGKPAALICTSGTAAANYYPAVIEAAQENIPLVILSADRPPELRDSGANQTIDQVKLFGAYVRWFFDLPAPDGQMDPAFVLRTVDRLLAHSDSGPVHLNCMFREPLAPEDIRLPEGYNQSIQRWEESARPWTRYEKGRTILNEETLNAVIRRINQAENGLVLLGRLNPNQDNEAVVQFCERLGWPVFADITSGWRLSKDLPHAIPYYDWLLSAEQPHFDTVVHLGGRYVSKRLMQLLEKNKPQLYYHIDDTGQTIDPVSVVTARLLVAPDQFCRQALPLMADRKPAQATLHLKNRSEKVGRILDETLHETDALNQPLLSRIVSELLPADGALFLASSLPVREMNWFGSAGKNWLPVAANRGASGIDGTVASAAGFAAGLEQTVTLLIGDLALLHDLNSLLILKNNEQPVIVIVENNHGGGIFHFLPIVEYDAVFESFFATPHQLNFEHAAKMFDLPYFTARTPAELRDVYQQTLKTRRSALIEVTTDRSENAKLHKTILQRIKERL